MPIVEIITDIDRSPDAPYRPGARSEQRRPAHARSARLCSEVQAPERKIPQMIHQAFRIARCGDPDPVCVVIPYPLAKEPGLGLRRSRAASPRAGVR